MARRRCRSHLRLASLSERRLWPSDSSVGTGAAERSRQLASRVLPDDWLPAGRALPRNGGGFTAIHRRLCRSRRTWSFLPCAGRRTDMAGDFWNGPRSILQVVLLRLHLQSAWPVFANQSLRALFVRRTAQISSSADRQNRRSDRCDLRADAGLLRLPHLRGAAATALLAGFWNCQMDSGFAAGPGGILPQRFVHSGPGRAILAGNRGDRILPANREQRHGRSGPAAG